MKLLEKLKWKGKVDTTRVLIAVGVASSLFVGYKYLVPPSPVDNPTIHQSVSKLDLNQITDFEKLLNDATSQDSMEYLNARWTVMDDKTLVVYLDIKSIQNYNRFSEKQAYTFAQGFGDNLQAFLQEFNNTFYNGRAAKGELVLIVKDYEGKEITRIY